MFDMQPIVSIVMANYNYGRFLNEAIQSVLAQELGDQVELIICDAASTDNSLEVIKKYEKYIAWWCSEPDGGQSAAFNKGFAHAHGKFLTWLNADDIMMPGTVKALAHAHKKHPECEWFTGNYLQFRQDNRKIIFAPWGPHVMPRAVQTFESPLAIFGPTTFWSMDAYRKVGPIDEKLHYSMDTDYWLRMKKVGYRQCRLNHCCWAFRMHDESKTAQYGEREIDDKVRDRWYEELCIVNAKVGYECSRLRRWLLWAVRAFDGSLAVAMFRRLFVVGKKLKST